VVTTAETAREVVAAVPDPELPVLTIGDLGILRAVDVDGDHVVVTITPTYSGCPAMDEIRADVVERLAEHGWHDVTVRTVLLPPWTTDWISEAGRRALREAGIAPPSSVSGPVPVELGRRPPTVTCPLCGSEATEELARFASTACKALWRCTTCREPFDHMKAH
jgi:ring-1,2-phenylacetyl-CoA epoxidase subunit PaaD